MQTFLIGTPQETAKILDRKRLFKQLLEGKQILDIIVNKKIPWSNHPAVRQWNQNPIGLFNYLTCIHNELRHKKIALLSQLYKQCCDIIDVKVDTSLTDFPDWIDRADIHSSHRSRLLAKGFIDALCADIKQQLKVKGLDNWLKARYGKTKNQMRYDDGLKLQSDFPQVNFITPNFYEQYGWKDDIRADYIWPV